MIEPEQIAANLARVQAQVSAAARRSGRGPGEVALLLATKTQAPAAIRAAAAAGARLIGENRVEELCDKAPALGDLPLERHLIGPLQRKKIGKLLERAGDLACVQSIDRLEVASRLSERWPGELGVFVQVNISVEPTKSGCPPADAVALAAEVAALPRLRLRGLMTIATPTDDPRVLAREYGQMRRLRDELASSGRPGTAAATELSMGMSHDFEIAIACGATMVRVGSAVFGPR